MTGIGTVEEGVFSSKRVAFELVELGTGFSLNTGMSYLGGFESQTGGMLRPKVRIEVKFMTSVSHLKAKGCDCTQK